VAYYHGTTDVTKQVVAGTLKTGTLAPNATYNLRAVATSHTLRPAMRDFRVTATSVSDPTHSDTVLFRPRAYVPPPAR
jgi:hypothetical protein